jgi:hypothetical protein
MLNCWYGPLTRKRFIRIVKHFCLYFLFRKVAAGRQVYVRQRGFNTKMPTIDRLLFVSDETSPII